MNDSITALQLGSRMHYAVPQILQQAGKLRSLWTDIDANSVPISFLRYLPAALRKGGMKRLMGRCVPGVPQTKVHSMNFRGLQYYFERTRGEEDDRKLLTHLKFGSLLGERASASGWNNCTHVYAFNSAAVKAFRTAKRAGVKCILEQTIAPRIIEQKILAAAASAHPGWNVERSNGRGFTLFCETEAEEWDLADQILCGSEFVLDSVREAGGPWEKCTVVPYGVKLSSAPRNQKTEAESGAKGSRLRVGFLGALSFRKGAPLLLELIKKLSSCIDIDIAGPLQISDAHQKAFSDVAKLLGPLARSEVPAFLQSLDVLILPSYCEGSAIVSYEALAQGIPVICTPNSGTIIQDGTSGFVIDSNSAELFIEKINELAESPKLLAKLKNGARARAAFGSIDAYAQRLIRNLSGEH